MSADPLRGMPKDLAKLGRQLRKQGWTVEFTRSQHVRWVAPDGTVFTSGLTPGAGGLHRTMKSLTGKMRELGSARRPV